MSRTSETPVFFSFILSSYISHSVVATARMTRNVLCAAEEPSVSGENDVFLAFNRNVIDNDICFFASLQHSIRHSYTHIRIILHTPDYANLCLVNVCYGFFRFRKNSERCKMQINFVNFGNLISLTMNTCNGIGVWTLKSNRIFFVYY